MSHVKEKGPRIMDGAFVLKLEGLTKRFPGVVAVDHVNLSVKQGEVHGIVGENGAGKSTLCNMITGVIIPDEGTIRYFGKTVRFTHPSEPLRLGIRMVHQDRNLVPYLTGAQNICLGEEPVSGLLIDEKRSLRLAEELRAQVGVRVRLDVPVSYLSASGQQMVEILRAVFREPRLLILDEPTASLTREDAEGMLRLVKTLQKRGITTIYISHKLDEVLSLCDRVTFLRDGKTVGTMDASTLDRATCVRLIANREIQSMFPPVHTVAGKKDVLTVDGVSDISGRVRNISFHVRERELVGIYGLVGAGRTEFVEVLFGLRPRKAGRIWFQGEELRPGTPTIQLIQKGIFLTPEDSRRKGIFHTIFNLRRNITVGQLDLLANRFGFIAERDEKEKAIRAAQALNTKYSSIEQSIDELSGGNRQKTLVARWLSRPGKKLFILDEPTQGIDVGTKYEIYVLLRRLVEEEGLSVIFVSSELPELLGVCDRLYVFKGGEVAGELVRGEFDQEKVVSMAI